MNIFKKIFGSKSQKERTDSIEKTPIESENLINTIFISETTQKAFIEYFFENEKKEIILPKEMQIDKVYDLGIGGWSIKARIYGLQKEYYIDFFAVHRMTNSRHQRILSNGEIESLENLWEFGYRTYENDPEKTEMEKQKMQSSNKRIMDIIEEKGLR
jgi:hypothetical protein